MKDVKRAKKIRQQVDKDDRINRKEAAYFAGMLQKLNIENDADLDRMSVFAEELDAHIHYGKIDLKPLFDYVVEKIADYEVSMEEKPGEELIDGFDVLSFLMDQHRHHLKDLSDVAPASVISEILHRKRRLNKGLIERLSAKYLVSPAVFFNPPRTK